MPLFFYIFPLCVFWLAVRAETPYSRVNLLPAEDTWAANTHGPVLQLGHIFKVNSEGKGVLKAAAADNYAVVCQQHGVSVAAGTDRCFRQLLGAEGDIRRQRYLPRIGGAYDKMYGRMGSPAIPSVVQ